MAAFIQALQPFITLFSLCPIIFYDVGASSFLKQFFVTLSLSAQKLVESCFVLLNRIRWSLRKKLSFAKELS